MSYLHVGMVLQFLSELHNRFLLSSVSHGNLAAIFLLQWLLEKAAKYTSQLESKQINLGYSKGEQYSWMIKIQL